MDNHSHIVLTESVRSEVPYKGVGGGKPVIPERDAHTHAQTLERMYEEAQIAYQQKKTNLPEGIAQTGGTYMEFRVNEKADSLKSLNTTRGSRIMNIRETSNADLKDVSVFIPEQKQQWFNKALQKYNVDPEENSNRARQALVNSIESISPIQLSSFFTSNGDYERITDNLPHEYEMWLVKEEFDEDSIKSRLTTLGVAFGNKVLVFDSINVMLITATKAQLEQIISCVKGISEFRPYHRPSALTQGTGLHDERDYMELISATVPMAEGDLSRIGVLDSGVNNAHPLIAPYLPDERCLSAITPSNCRDRVLHGHGTEMTGLALYGDLTDVIYATEPQEVTSDIAAVKILPDDDTGQYTNEMYAVITEDAIGQARDVNAQVLCSAVTNKQPSDACEASSTSAAIDQTLFNQGNSDAMMLISAGNIEETNGQPYPDYLSEAAIFDPAQSWNALTVGAYTEKILPSDPIYDRTNVVAPAGGICPFSRTSVKWGPNTPIKPEIMMEGGNAIINNGQLDLADDLMPVSTYNNPLVHKFWGFNATSSATALAAHLAGQIKYKYPTLSPLGIRALMVHSAQWTEAMLNMAASNGAIDYDKLLHTCGYGVPNKDKACLTTDSYVTFISEDVIKPFEQTSGEPKFARFNLYEMPWPEETLRALGEAQVELKLTLSYYIEPCPGSRGRLNKYAYQSIRLNFDVIQPEETLEQFKRRISHLGEENPLHNDTSRWTIGIQRRNQGSVMSDSIKRTAAQIANCRYIAIYPTGGWYKTRKEKSDASIKYSLIVSIETPGQEIYSEIMQKIEIAETIINV